MLTVERLNSALEPLSIPLANLLGLPRLPSYFGIISLSFAGFHIIERVISPWFFGRLYPEHYGKASPRVRQGWATRACSMIHAIGVVYLASRAINKEELIHDKIRGIHPAEGLMEAFSAGFIWDAMEETVFHYQDLGLALHGILVLTGITLTFRPLFPYSSVNFLFQEMSTPFLNIHWFLDKTNRTGTKLQLVNGIILIITFFLARICFGSLATYRLYTALIRARSESKIAPLLFWIYILGSGSLQFLNWFWLYKMFSALQKRFTTGDEEGTNSNGKMKLL